MSINISASLLVDYLSCQRKPLYRIQYPELAIPNKEMIVGSAVHSAIEKHSNNSKEAVDYALNYLLMRNVSEEEQLLHAEVCISNFFSNFASLLSRDGLIEYKFKLPFTWEDVFIVGKIDRISGGQIFDWKTSRNPPKKLFNDIQFIIYEWAYKQLNNAPPVASYYGALANGVLLKHHTTEEVGAYVFEELIPQVVSGIRQGSYPHTGIFTKSCFRCPYRDTCLNGESNVVDSGTFN